MMLIRRNQNERGSLTRSGIIKEMLADVWAKFYDIKDETKPTKHEIKTRAVHELTGRILDKYEKERRDRTDQRRSAFTKEYREVKTLFAFRQNDEALKRLKKMQERKW